LGNVFGDFFPQTHLVALLPRQAVSMTWSVVLHLKASLADRAFLIVGIKYWARRDAAMTWDQCFFGYIFFIFNRAILHVIFIFVMMLQNLLNWTQIKI
jgi:hypothetical protein